MQLSQTLIFPKITNVFKDLGIILGMSVLFAISSWIAIRLPFTPVPIIFTPQLILFFSVIFGRKAVYATGAFLLEGLLGLPVFANGNSGILYMCGPTGGYLVGYLVAAVVVAFLIEKIKEKNCVKTFWIMILGNALIFAFGLFYLSQLIGISKALQFGLYPFIGGDLVKIFLAHRATRKFV